MDMNAKVMRVNSDNSLYDLFIVDFIIIEHARLRCCAK